MVAGEAGHGSASAAEERQLPPIAEVAVTSMAFVVIGGVYMASYVPKSVPMAIPLVCLVIAGGLLLGNTVALARMRDFAWTRFRQVFQWTLLAYVVIAGMIGCVFVIDGTRGSVLAVMLPMLAIFAVDIPTLLAFSVARYEDAGSGWSD